MRHARANDHWRHIMDSERKRPLRLRSLSFRNAIGLGDGQINLHHALTIVCGSNGVGKSTMLSVCGLTLNFQSADDRSKSRFASIETSLELSSVPDHGVVHAVKITEGSQCNDPGGLEFEFHRVDVGSDWFRIRTLVESESNWDELLAQHGGRDLNEDELGCLRRLTGKPYASCRLYEIDEYQDGIIGPFPYCVVNCDGAEYALEEMGTGEGSLFLIWWSLSQVRRPGIFLLEEPETHITPQSQRAMMDLIAEKCDKLICCIITTHSPDVISHVPCACLRLLVRHNNQVHVLNSPDEGQLQQVLGVAVPKTVILTVEDRCASTVAKEILRVFRSDISSRVHITIGGSDSEVVGALKHFPQSTPGPKLVGVLDGDMKENYDLTALPDVFIPAGLKHPLEFLPWSTAPDAYLRSNCSRRAQEIAQALTISEAHVTIILSSIEGLDHHDWIEELGRRLDVSFEKIVQTLLHVVMVDPERRQECETFADRIAHHAAFVTG